MRLKGFWTNIFLRYKNPIWIQPPPSSIFVPYPCNVELAGDNCALFYLTGFQFFFSNWIVPLKASTTPFWLVLTPSKFIKDTNLTLTYKLIWFVESKTWLWPSNLLDNLSIKMCFTNSKNSSIHYHTPNYYC